MERIFDLAVIGGGIARDAAGREALWRGGLVVTPTQNATSSRA